MNKHTTLASECERFIALVFSNPTDDTREVVRACFFAGAHAVALAVGDGSDPAAAEALVAELQAWKAEVNQGPGGRVPAGGLADAFYRLLRVVASGGRDRGRRRPPRGARSGTERIPR